MFRLKFIRSVLVVSILIEISSIAVESPAQIPLKCKFRTQNIYTCITSALENHNVSVEFSEIRGTHEKDKSNDDVQGLVIKGQNVSFMPRNVGSFFPKLTRYEVKDSSLFGVSKENFVELKQIETLVLANNLITMLNPDTFEDLTNLRQLRLHGNKLTELHYKVLAQNHHIEIITLNNNNIKFIHEQLLMSLHNIREIYLQNNEIEDLREQTFVHNKNLELIDLSSNKLKSVGPLVLDGLIRLKHFNFSNNICVTRDYKQVEDLVKDLRNSCFPPYFRRFDDNIKNLTSMNGKLNEALKDCETNLDEEKSLKATTETEINELREKVASLETDNEQLNEKLSEINTNLEEQKNDLEEKTKERNSLKEKNEKLQEQIKNSTNLTSPLQTCHNELIAQSRKLQEIQSYHATCENDFKNYISQLPICSSFFIDCNYSELSLKDETEYICKTKHLSACKPGMKLVDVGGTHIYEKSKSDVTVLHISDSIFQFTNDIFQHFFNLRKMKILNGGLSSLEPKLSSRNLVELEIDGNKITEILGRIFSDVARLKSVLLENNEIEKLNHDSFVDLIDLRQLSLASNRITELPKGVFDDLISLSHLSLKNNNLRSLDGDLFKRNKKLQIIKFDDNKDLHSIDVALFNYSPIKMAHFSGTCAGYYDDINDLKMSIKSNCQMSI